MKKLFSLFFTLNFTLLLLWSMPYFESYIPDSSGDFIYYKDNSFLRESYIGILYYDDSTVQLRYYAPEDKKQKLPENDISILLSLNPESEHLELTGERILSTITPNTDDVTIVNYLHDILYDFSGKRSRVQDLNDRNIEIFTDYDKFGGKVNIIYDYTVPIFNIRSISNPENEEILKLVTIGQITSNTDPSFDNFKGFPIEKNTRSKKRYKKAKPSKQSYGKLKVVLDENWLQKMENMWALNNNDAILSLNTLRKPTVPENVRLEDYLIKFFAKGSQDSYLIYDTLDIKKDTENNFLEIYAESYSPVTDKTVVNNIILTQNEEFDYLDLFSLIVYKEPWIINKKYYENIINSYKN